MKMSNRRIAIALLVVVAAAVLVYNSPPLKSARFAEELVARNIEARGGVAWQDVSTLRLIGRMDLGQEMIVPYTLEQKWPGKMCLEFVFDSETAVQCADGNTGWKIVPFMGVPGPQAMTAVELRETAGTVHPYGPLYDYAARGNKLNYLGAEQLEGRTTHKLQVTLPKGAVRWLYLDEETALEVKFETKRTLAGKELLVETRYTDWQAQDGLLIARRQDTQTEGNSESHFLTISSVEVNPPIDDARFSMPAATENIAIGQGSVQ
jgi:hypothetical protein